MHFEPALRIQAEEPSVVESIGMRCEMLLEPLVQIAAQLALQVEHALARLDRAFAL
ncbi:hypothetical protein D3C83_332400 [compost metagenome]